MLPALITECVTSKAEARILKKCVVSTKVKEKDSTNRKLEIIYTPSLIAVPGPTVYKTSPCDSTGKLKNFKETSTKNGITQTIEGKDGKLTGTCNADSLKLIIESQKETIERFKTTEKEIEIRDNCQLQHRTQRDGALLYYFYVTAPIWLILIIYGLYRLYKWFRK